MFGLGMPEILLILALALIIIGPKKLPDLAKTLGKSLREFKGAAQDFKNSINMETSITDIDPSAEEIQKNIKAANKELADSEDKDNDTDDAGSDDGVSENSDVSDSDNTDLDTKKSPANENDKSDKTSEENSKEKLEKNDGGDSSE
jgi:Tat protein translocase TatB subunit